MAVVLGVDCFALLLTAAVLAALGAAVLRLKFRSRGRHARGRGRHICPCGKGAAPPGLDRSFAVSCEPRSPGGTPTRLEVWTFIATMVSAVAGVAGVIVAYLAWMKPH